MAGALLAGPAAAADVKVSDAWFRALPAHLPAGGYFTLHNSGTAEIALTGAETPACAMVMVHRSSESEGLSRMEDVASVPVAAGGNVAFAPGGYHLMCMRPTAAMTPKFSDGSRTTAKFAVRNAQGK